MAPDCRSVPNNPSTTSVVCRLALVGFLITGAASAQQEPEQATVESLLVRGRELLDAHGYEEAISVLEQAVLLAPESLAARMALVTALRRVGQHDQARRRLEEAIGRFPESEEPVVSLGYLDRALGRLDESVRWFHRGAQMPGGWYNHIRLAVSYTDLGDLDRMAEAAAALGDSPYGAPLGQTLEHLFRGEFEAGLEVAEAQLEARDDEMWRSFAATLSVLLHDDARALRHYRLWKPALFEEDPVVTPPEASEALWLAFVFERSGDKARAAGLARSALAVLEPASLGYELPLRKTYRSAAQVMLGDLDAALAEFRAAVDAGYRSILFDRTVRFEEFEMFAPLHERSEFQQMIAEIKADNARMLEQIRRDGVGSPGASELS